MSALIIDIETIGENFDEMDEITKKILTKYVKSPKDTPEYQQELEKIKNELCFSHLTGSIVTIGLIDSVSGKGAVYFQAPDVKIDEFEKDGVKFKTMTEKEMLEKFWSLATKYNKFVTFNGRGFDIPYIIGRSAANKIKPTKNLMSNRYLNSQMFNAKHIDLLEELTFYGAVWNKKGNLHLWCRMLGIKSPKDDGIEGDNVGELFRNKEYLKIAEYNCGDIRSTRELYHYWKEYYKI